ncbi:MAG: YtxH domain-containing protein [Bacteroidales bacterium]|nr:YtxH domain-containing protein [Bacteroidales bacterium]MBN2756376.1 YtxH domain-containing protein [Bacteroidales bacterium]
MDSGGKLLAAFIAGALAGAGIGILLAPEKGKVTREKLKGSIDGLSDKAKEAYKKAQQAYDDFMKEANVENEEKSTSKA